MTTHSYWDAVGSRCHLAFDDVLHGFSEPRLWSRQGDAENGINFNQWWELTLFNPGFHQFYKMANLFRLNFRFLMVILHVIHQRQSNYGNLPDIYTRMGRDLGFIWGCLYWVSHKGQGLAVLNKQKSWPLMLCDYFWNRPPFEVTHFCISWEGVQVK